MKATQVIALAVIVCAGAVGAPADACIDTVTVGNPDNAGADTDLVFAVSLAQQTVVVEASTDDLGKLSDQDLQERTDSILALADQLHHDDVLISGEFRTAEYESCLTEIIRRGGERWERYLRERLESLDAKVIRQGEAGDSSMPGTYRNLELLTALRRVQRRPDPLTILTFTDAPLTITLPELPSLKVRIQNVDVRKHDVGFTFGGNYRSGRQARWKVAALWIVVSSQGEQNREDPRALFGCRVRGSQGVEQHRNGLRSPGENLALRCVARESPSDVGLNLSSGTGCAN